MGIYGNIWQYMGAMESYSPPGPSPEVSVDVVGMVVAMKRAAAMPIFLF